MQRLLEGLFVGFEPWLTLRRNQIARARTAADLGIVDTRRDSPVVLQRGQFVAVLGPSGCGKSTLLMMLGGLEAVTAGRIAVGGEPMTGARTSIGIMFQDPTPVAVEERARQRAVSDPCPEAAAR